MSPKQPKSLALWLDFAPDFERIRREHSPIEVNQIVDPTHPPAGIEYVECDTLSELVEFLKKQKKILVLTKQTPVMEKFCADNDIEAEIHAWKLGGPSFTMPMNNEEWIMNNGGSLCIITDELIWPLLGGVFRRKKKRPQLDLLVQIKAGDPVVHLFHGVGIFQWIVRNTLSGTEREYIEIEYAEKDRLFVPVEELHRVSKFVGETTPTLTRLGSPSWKLILAKTNEEIQKIAEELLANHAARRLAGGVSMMDFPEKEETFHIAFPHKHTLDQEDAIQGIMQDMNSEKPMDRLLSGDVGFWKTEVSLHAVYRAFLNEKQTIFLAPLVVLAYEHYESISERLKPFGVNVAMMTRMSTTKEIKSVLAGLKDGSIHCVIGTHRLLSPDIKFRNLGLVVVDEEHKFGVTDKEKIMHLKAGVDTLALSATPIPRSLNLALSGVKNFSILSTPPTGKKPIHTAVARYDQTIVKRAIEEELARGGKVFFVHNTIKTLPILKKEIESLVPKAKVVITNGQLPSDELEDRIMEFKLGMHNVLLTTTVIENGINFLDTNTIIIDEAEDFGLAQLHQLRWRVGRWQIQGICYLMYRQPELQDEARERLMTIANHTHLGAGFEIALRDMEIRWVGDVLWVRQSGKTRDVGVSFYLKLLEQKIEELQSWKKETKVDTTIDLPISAYIPDEAFSSDIEKIHFYRELESVRSEEELMEVIEPLKTRIDVKQSAVDHLFLLIRARLRLSSLGIKRVHMQLGKYTLEWGGEGEKTLEAMKELLKKDTKQCAEVMSGKKICYSRKAFQNHGDFLRYFVV